MVTMLGVLFLVTWHNLQHSKISKEFKTVKVVKNLAYQSQIPDSDTNEENVSSTATHLNWFWCYIC